jgi:ParB-like chromosome segregation protein Spo0J
LVDHPRNYNTHPSEQIRLLAKIIQHQGWRNPITVSKRSGFVVKGHGRLAAAMLLKTEKVPVDVQDYKDEASEVADMIADNRIAELAEADTDALKGLLIDDVFDNFDLDLTGFDAEEINSLLKSQMENDHMLHGQENESTREEIAEAYANSDVRQILLLYGPEEYELVIEKLESIRRTKQLETNVDVLNYLLDLYEKAEVEKA